MLPQGGCIRITFFNNELGDLWQNFTRQVESIQNIFLLLNCLLPGQDTVSGSSIGGSVKYNPLNIDGSGLLKK